MRELGLPVRKWVPNWLALISIFIIILPITMLNGSYTGSMLEVSNTLDTNTEDITMGYYAASAGMAIAYPIVPKVLSAFSVKFLLLADLALQFILSWICARSQSADILIVASFAIGFLKGFLMLWFIRHAQKIFSPKNVRSEFYSYFYPLVYGSGQISMVLTAELAYHYNWKYMYYFMMLLLLLAILLVIVCYRHNRPLQKIPIEELHLREMFVIAIGLLMLMYVINYGKILDWMSSYKICAYIAIAPILIAFFVWMQYHIDGYHTVDFIREFDGRDARMAQTVISPTYKMKISGRERLYSPNWKVTRTGYHPIKWSIDDDADNVLSKAASWNSLPILRYAEVLLNYAEAKAELGEMDAAVWDQTIAQLRSRAGVTPVVPDKADPYMEAYFLNTVTDKWILEVRRERGIELCLEMGLRWDDDMRWHMGDLLTSDNNPWTGIWIGNTGYTYDFTGQSTDDNGDPVPDFYIRPGEDTEHSIAISNTGANQTFSLNAAGNIVWEYKRTWGEKKYLRPIPQTAITRNPNLEQNALWK